MLITLGHGVFSDTSAEERHVLLYNALFPYSFQFLFESGELFCELAQDRLLHQCSRMCAPNVVVRCRADDPCWPFLESFATVHRGHFYSNPSAGTLLSTDDHCNPSTILNSAAENHFNSKLLISVEMFANSKYA